MTNTSQLISQKRLRFAKCLLKRDDELPNGGLHSGNCMTFYNTQILREINFADSKSAKSAFLTHLDFKGTES